MAWYLEGDGNAHFIVATYLQQSLTIFIHFTNADVFEIFYQPSHRSCSLYVSFQFFLANPHH